MYRVIYKNEVVAVEDSYEKASAELIRFAKNIGISVDEMIMTRDIYNMYM
jgi:hypothetical protein